MVDNAVEPTYAKEGDAGMDLTAVSVRISDRFIEYGTGLIIEIPEGYVGKLYARSSVSNTDLTLANCVGIVEHTYRGEIKLRFSINNKVYNIESFANNDNNAGQFRDDQIEPIMYEVGDRIGQIIIERLEKWEFNQIKENEELTATNRGEQGFGSSGR